MTVDIKSVIGELLYEFDAVIIPAFGGFVANYKSSTIDHVQGMIHPPSKSLTFNENLVVNDGLIVNHLKKRFGMNLDEAKSTVKDFVEELKEKIDEREIIVFPNVGRLYRDYENKLQFLPDNSNYNLDVFGLPTVQYYPILRNRDVSTTEAPAPKAVVTKRTSTPKRVKRPSVFQAVMPYLLGLALVAVAISIWSIVGTRTKDDSQANLPVSENRINTKPTLQEASYETEVDDQFGTAITDPNSTEESSTEASSTPVIPEVDDEIDTESITLTPDQKECVVIVGGFRSKDNVRKLIERLYNQGYDAYQDEKDGITRVGAQFFYESEEQRKDKIKDIRKKFEPKAWVLKE